MVLLAVAGRTRRPKLVAAEMPRRKRPRTSRMWFFVLVIGGPLLLTWYFVRKEGKT